MRIEVYLMINFNNEKNMYDLFIDNKTLTTQELLGVGFTNKDLTRLIEAGKIRRVSRGIYELENAQGLFKYTQILFSKRCKNSERGKNAGNFREGRPLYQRFHHRLRQPHSGIQQQHPAPAHP